MINYYIIEENYTDNGKRFKDKTVIREDYSFEEYQECWLYAFLNKFKSFEFDFSPFPLYCRIPMN